MWVNNCSWQFYFVSAAILYLIFPWLDTLTFSQDQALFQSWVSCPRHKLFCGSCLIRTCQPGGLVLPSLMKWRFLSFCCSNPLTAVGMAEREKCTQESCVSALVHACGLCLDSNWPRELQIKSKLHPQIAWFWVDSPERVDGGPASTTRT